MRCRPSILMSPTVNEPGSDWASTAGTANRAGSAARSFSRRMGRSAEQPRQVVVEGEAHQHQQQQQADLLAHGLGALGERAALGEFRELIDDLAAVEDGDGE